MRSKASSVRFTDKADISLTGVYVSVMKEPTVLSELVGEEAVRRVVETDILPAVFDTHKADITLVYVTEGPRSAVQINVHRDISDGRREVNVYVFCGVTVREVTGMADSITPEVRIPANMKPGQILRVGSCTGMKIQIHSAAVVPVDKKSHTGRFVGNPPGKSAADVGAVL